MDEPSLPGSSGRAVKEFRSKGQDRSYHGSAGVLKWYSTKRTLALGGKGRCLPGIYPAPELKFCSKTGTIPVFADRSPAQRPCLQPGAGVGAYNCTQLGYDRFSTGQPCFNHLAKLFHALRIHPWTMEHMIFARRPFPRPLASLSRALVLLTLS